MKRRKKDLEMVSSGAKTKRSPGDIAVDVVIYTVFGIFAFACFWPFYYLFINSISNNDLVENGRILFTPMGVHFDNYVRVMKIGGIGKAAAISVIRTVVGTILHVLCTSFMGYVMSRQELWHRKFCYRYVILTMYLSVGLIPVYMNIRSLGLINNPLLYVITGIVGPYNMILVKTYVESIGQSLEESAVIDGAGYTTRFTRVILPLCKPVLASIAVFRAVGEWNAYMDTIIYMPNGKWETLQSLLFKYLNQATALAKMLENGEILDDLGEAVSISPAGVRYTLTFITVFPILLVYPYFQRFFTKGIMLGAVKG